MKLVSVDVSSAGYQGGGNNPGWFGSGGLLSGSGGMFRWGLPKSGKVFIGGIRLARERAATGTSLKARSSPSSPEATKGV